MKKIITFFICAFIAVANADAAVQSAYAQLTRTAAALQAPVPVPAPASAPQCLSADGRWGGCPDARRWNVPESALAYLVDNSSRTYIGTSHPPRSVVYMAEYYEAETAVSLEVARYCSAQGRGASAECSFAMAPGTKKIYDGNRVYLVNGGNVAEIDDKDLSAAAGEALADNGIRVRVGSSRAQSAVGCAMKDDCWNSLNDALNAQASWESAEAAKAEAAAKGKDKG